METKRKMQNLVGVIVSDKMDKTRVIQVEWKQNHKLFLKKVSHHARYFVHDEKNLSHEGDRVRVVSCRPLSKNKHFRLSEVLSKRLS